MDFAFLSLAALAGAALAYVVCASRARAASAGLQAHLEERSRQAETNARELAATRVQLAEANMERVRLASQLESTQTSRQAMTETFQALSAEVLQRHTQGLLATAKALMDQQQQRAQGELRERQNAIAELLTPVRESLAQVDREVREIEKEREGAYRELRQQVLGLSHTQESLRQETARLVSALRTPVQRGRWGEMQLQRVVEMAGMSPHCDFVTQVSRDTDQGRIRPDLIVRLPSGKCVVVDAKVSLQAYLEAVDATEDGARQDKLRQHASQVRNHLTGLAAKGYWEQFDHTPEFVVAFLPGEAFFSAALEQDPSLLEFGVERQVILATPTTLIALLKSVHYGWQQERLARNALEVRELGHQLVERLSVMCGHLGRLKKGLDQSVDAFNATVGSLESRVLVTARRFRELGAAGGQELETVEPVDRVARGLSAGE